jgi:hypothetical protein
MRLRLPRALGVHGALPADEMSNGCQFQGMFPRGRRRRRQTDQRATNGLRGGGGGIWEQQADLNRCCWEPLISQEGGEQGELRHALQRFSS